MSDLSQNIELLEPIAERLRVMGHPLRLVIIASLKNEERCVSDIASLVGLNLATVSYHLKAMERAGLLRSTRRGRRMVYRIEAPMVGEVCLAICHQVESELKSSEKRTETWTRLKSILEL